MAACLSCSSHGGDGGERVAAGERQAAQTGRRVDAGRTPARQREGVAHATTGGQKLSNTS